MGSISHLCLLIQTDAIRSSRTFEVSVVIRSRDAKTAVLEDRQGNTYGQSSKRVSDEDAQTAQNLDVSISSLSCPIVTITRPLPIHLGALPSVPLLTPSPKKTYPGM